MLSSTNLGAHSYTKKIDIFLGFDKPNKIKKKY